MKLRVFVLMLCAALFGAPACGGLSTGKVPADSELKPWEAPDEDDLVADEDDEDDDDEDAEDEDADEDDGDGDDGASAAATGDGAATDAAATK